MPVTNVLLVESALGWTERVRSSSVGSFGRHEALLSVGSLNSTAEVNRVADAQLDIYSLRREEITAELQSQSTADDFMTGYKVGDTVTVPDSTDAPTTERVLSVTVTEERDTGVARVVPALKDELLDHAERAAQRATKLVTGSVAGQSKVAQRVDTAPVTEVPAERKLYPGTRIWVANRLAPYNSGPVVAPDASGRLLFSGASGGFGGTLGWYVSDATLDPKAWMGEVPGTFGDLVFPRVNVSGVYHLTWYFQPGLGPGFDGTSANWRTTYVFGGTAPSSNDLFRIVTTTFDTSTSTWGGTLNPSTTAYLTAGTTICVDVGANMSSGGGLAELAYGELRMQGPFTTV